MVMEHVRLCNWNDITFFLDQEKAYDQVHPSYLRAVMLKFGFPLVLVSSIIGLFFGNRVSININGRFNIIVSDIYICFMKIRLNPFQDALINYSCRYSMSKF